ncbi:hypothetical protein PTKIN_Ptkin09bG0022700 [Pterospermum kingtungense]
MVFDKNPSLLSLRLFSTSSNQQSFAVSYLINKCGFSPESALHATKSLKLETPDNADSVIAFFKDHGFSKSQITTLLRRRPRLLLSDVGKLLPKVVFFYSKGFSRSDLSSVLSKYPTTLSISLENQIIPSFNILRDLLLSDENVIKVIKRYPRSLSYDFDAYMLPNFKILRNCGVSENNIVKALQWLPQTFFRSPVQLKEIVEKLKEMGFNPEKVSYVIAVYTLGSMSKSTLGKKISSYKMYGLSEEEVLEAFRACPQMMTTSEAKIIAVMDFLVNEMGLQPSLIAKRPRLITQSLEKRIVPRGLFAQDLLSKGLVKKELNLRAVFEASEKSFIEKFVNRYEADAPELLKLYQEKFDLSNNWKAGISRVLNIANAKLLSVAFLLFELDHICSDTYCAGISHLNLIRVHLRVDFNDVNRVVIYPSYNHPEKTSVNETATKSKWAPLKSLNFQRKPSRIGNFSARLSLSFENSGFKQFPNGVGEKDGIIIVDRGSRRRESNLMLNEFVIMFREKTEYPIVEPPLMELAEPLIRDAFGLCVQQGAGRVIVSPFFLFPRRHWYQDVVNERIKHCLSHVAGNADECASCAGTSKCKLY